MQYYFNIELLFSVPPTVFTPPPKVESGVIRLTPRLNKPEISDLNKYWKLIEFAFQQRRKMLRNNVKHLVTQDQYEKLIQTTPIDLNRRGESLDEQEFILLFRAIELL
jgi:16S rRNA (adenine1518-N6/adenine1519-N6)-dimethyltransferase